MAIAKTPTQVHSMTVILIITFCFGVSVGLKCFQCLDYKPGGSCVHDYKTQTNTSMGIFKNNGTRPYYKECLNSSSTDPELASYNVTNNYCLIEEYYLGGNLVSFIRDCSDGKLFSFNSLFKNEPSKVLQVAPDNYTTCVYRVESNAHVCVTLCAGDFCNGPQPGINGTDDSNETEICYDDYGENTTCGAQSVFYYGRRMMWGGSGLLILDQLLSQVFFLPIFVSLVCAYLL